MTEPNVNQFTEGVYRRLERPLSLPFIGEVDGHYWGLILIPILILAVVYVVLMYIRDGHAIGWVWAAFLGVCRCCVYGILAWAFLMPADQTYNEVRRESRVLIHIDVSGSMQTRDEIPTAGQRIEDIPTRQDYVIKLMAEKDGFIKKMLETNPIFAYRFGRFADESYLVFEKDGTYWTRDQWEDKFRPRKNDEPAPEGADRLSLNWGNFLKPVMKDEDDEEKLDDEQKKQLERLRRLRGGTNIGDSVSTVFNREMNNMLQGVVVVTDGRNTEGTHQAITDLAERAQKAKIPIFVIAVGEDRPPIRIEIADVRSPDVARPDDPFKIEVHAKGDGLPNQDVTIYLDVYRPGDDKKPYKTETKIIKFKPGTPPRAEVEFEITPENYGEEVTDKPSKPDEKKPGDKKPDEKKPDDKPASGKKSLELPEGEWRFIARIPKDRQEIFAGTEHVSDKVVVNVRKRPMRVLLFASAPTRDYQFVRSLMVREAGEKKRVDLCIHLQPIPNSTTPRIGHVQDVEPKRLLKSFPSQLKDDKDEPDEALRFDNLGSYDLVVAFDPDWSQLNKSELDHVEKWVGNGGGLIVLAGPINTLDLARPGVKEGAERSKLQPILDLYPVKLEDARIKDLERKTDEPYRLNFPGATDEMEFLKLNEEDEKATFKASWDEFFDGPGAKGEAPKPGEIPTHPLRGFFNYYPVKSAKNKAVVIASFADPQANLPDGKEMPYLVTATAGTGRVVWIGSGETWRLRQYKEAFHERFWTKLTRFAGSGNAGKISQRVRPNMGQFFLSNTYVPVEVQLFDRDLQPIDKNAKPKVKLELPGAVTDIPKEYDLKPRPGGEWTGWFTGRFLVKSPGEYKITFEAPDTGETVVRKFVIKESNPELDNTRPDYDTMYDLASEADDVLSRVNDQTRKDLLARLLKPVKGEKAEGEAPTEPKDAVNRDKPHLLFELKNADIIPSCMTAQLKEEKNRGQVHDTWDNHWLLATAVGLLALEWLTRKLLRLA
jgi:uncharacterized membrane protein